TVAPRACRSHGEESARVRDLTATMTGRARLGLCPGRGAAAAAFFAGVENVEGDFLFDAAGGFFEIDFKVVPQIVAAGGATASAARLAAEGLLEEVVEDAAGTATEDFPENIHRIVKPAPLPARAR